MLASAGLATESAQTRPQTANDGGSLKCRRRQGLALSLRDLIVRVVSYRRERCHPAKDRFVFARSRSTEQPPGRGCPARPFRLALRDRELPAEFRHAGVFSFCFPKGPSATRGVRPDKEYHLKDRLNRIEQQMKQENCFRIVP